MHGEAQLGTVGLLDPDLAGHEVTHQRGMPVEDRQGPVGRRQDDRRGTTGEQGLFGRDDLQAEDTVVGH